jgi:peptidoglycan lytic transglycosylase
MVGFKSWWLSGCNRIKMMANDTCNGGLMTILCNECKRFAWYLFGMVRNKNIVPLACFLCCIGVAMLIGCATAPEPTKESGGGEVGMASYYADRFHGRQTASGERYDRNALTAAHRRLPFGTLVQVTRLDSEKTVEVRINDRGPFVKGRVIDLSYAAAERLGMLRRGVVRVRLVLPD